jgi:hypothetical protein
MNVCEVCNEPKRRGYRINPRTARRTPTRFWCDDCYERIVRQSAQRNTSGNETGGLFGHANRDQAPPPKPRKRKPCPDSSPEST